MIITWDFSFFIPSISFWYQSYLGLVNWYFFISIIWKCLYKIAVICTFNMWWNLPRILLRYSVLLVKNCSTTASFNLMLKYLFSMSLVSRLTDSALINIRRLSYFGKLWFPGNVPILSDFPKNGHKFFCDFLKLAF